jgi:large repetitive protein
LGAGGKYISPAFVDIDGDGDLDAFVGDFNGNTLFFQNTGSAASAVFTAATTNPFGLSDVGTFAAPSFADIDGDGDLDAFVGNGSDMLFFQNTGSAASATFAAAVTNPFGLASAAGGNGDPAFADIDGDGDMDAFIGNGSGDILFYENTGSLTNATFAAAITNPFGLSNVGNNAAPTFADIDGDGDLDAFVGNSNNTLFFENTGSASNATFAAAVSNSYGLSSVTQHAAPAFADIDADGDLDAFVADGDGDMQFFMNNNVPSVISIVRAASASANVASSATSVDYTVTFSESVTGVDASDFSLTTTGTASGAIASVTGSGSTYTVTVNSLGNDGTLRLDLKSSGTGIQNSSSKAIAGGYTGGQTYSLDHTAPTAPSTPDMTAGTDSAINTDNITNDTTPTFTGTAEAGIR